MIPTSQAAAEGLIELMMDVVEVEDVSRLIMTQAIATAIGARDDAVRADALEEAAQACVRFNGTNSGLFASIIRALKERA